MRKSIFTGMFFVSAIMIASTSFGVKSLVNLGGVLTAVEVNSPQVVKLDHQEEFDISAPVNHILVTIDQNGVPTVNPAPICNIQGTIVAVDLEVNPPAPLATLSCTGLLNGSTVTAELQAAVVYFRDGQTNKRVKTFYHWLTIKNSSGVVVGSLDSQSQSDLFKLNTNKMIKTSIINLAIVPNGGFDGIQSSITFDKN